MNLNLARKWRSKQFDEIVGQQLAVRLVKNSLYRNLLFPVYLLSGTRGTGKTSTGRIFAAALNCSKLADFQQDPRNVVVPCLFCDSCSAMLQANHPDFIEIDAASHTGVDNVRQIIDAASFVPVLGKKKIYLIDEAHMLSKAAFNAFLKILEEPPPSVVFMLATTDPHKIIPTVLSRCFQLFFEPIKPMQVVHHLQYICEQENLPADPDALLLIAQETEGSMRDALNLLERLRALPEVLNTSDKPAVITKGAVIHLLGSIDEDRLATVLLAVASQDSSRVLATIEQAELMRFNPSTIWKKLVETLRRSLWLKQGISPDDAPVSEQLHAFIAAIDYQRLITLLDLCYTYELSFAKTAVPHTMLEVLLLKMTTAGGPQMTAAPPPAKMASPKPPTAPVKQTTKVAARQEPVIPVVSKTPVTQQPAPVQQTTKALAPQGPVIPGAAASKRASVAQQPIAPLQQSTKPVETQEPVIPGATASKSSANPAVPVQQAQQSVQKPQPTVVDQKKTQSTISSQSSSATESQDSKWSQCLSELEGLSDPLVISIFKQAANVSAKEGKLTMNFAQDLLFFGDWLNNTQKIWQPIIATYYGAGTQVIPQFTGPSTKKKHPAPPVSKPMNTPPASQEKSAPAKQYARKPQTAKPAGKQVSAEDVKHLETSTMIMETFQGTLRVENLPKESA